MFDANEPFPIPVWTRSGKAVVTVRCPEDEEWIQYRKARRAYVHLLGRGAQELEVQPGESDLKLYDAIKLNGAPQLTAGEAAKIMEVLSHCEVVGLELGSDEAEVRLILPTGPAKHFIKIPTTDQVKELQRTTRVITHQYNRQEFRPNLEAAARLWDQLGARAEGYTGRVPNIHKEIAVRAVISEIDQATAPKYDESSF